MDNEPYYYPTTGWNGQDCTQPCLVRKDGTMIGSNNCQECPLCTDKGVPYNEYLGPDWIMCSMIDEATGGTTEPPDYLEDTKREGLTTDQVFKPIINWFAHWVYYALVIYIWIFVYALPNIFEDSNIEYVEGGIRLILVIWITYVMNGKFKAFRDKYGLKYE